VAVDVAPVDALVALGRDPTAALALAGRLAADGTCRHLVVHVSDDPGQPYASVLRVDAGTSPATVRPVADIALFRAHERHVKGRAVVWPLGTASPGIACVYGTRRHPSLDRAAYDAHWRDVHGPLAVRHHIGMCDYWQCAIDERLSGDGPDYDGIAVVQFPSPEDLAERFFDGPEGRDAIQRDAASFTDLATLDRVLMTEYVFCAAD